MKFLLVFFLHLVYGQDTCGDVSTFPCPVETNFPRDDIFRTYIVKVTIQGSSELPQEDERNWGVFNDPLNDNGYNDSAALRNYKMRFDVNGLGVIVSFELPFSANLFMKRSQNHEKLMQKLLKAPLVDWLGLDQSFIDSNLAVQVTTPDNCANVEQPCDAIGLDCLEISQSGLLRCLSPCDQASLVSTCGTHATCSQKADPNEIGQYSDPVCECEGDYWWRSNDGINDCRPVMQNWLIIVIAVVGFLVVMLIIFLIVYCCVRGCSCPTWCGPCCCCCKREDDRDLVYKVTEAQVNQSFQSDEGEKKLPLPESAAYSSQAHTVRNPAIWYDMPTDDFGLVRSGQPHGTILTTASANEYGATLRSVSEYQSKTEERKHRPRPKHRHRSDKSSRSRHQSKDSNPFLDELHKEVGKLTREVEDLRKSQRSTNHPQKSPRKMEVEEDDSGASTLSSTIQAPLPDNSPLDALELSDEPVDGSETLHRHQSKEILVATPDCTGHQPGTLSNTLKERWRVPALRVLPVHDKYPIRSIDSSVI